MKVLPALLLACLALLASCAAPAQHQVRARLGAVEALSADSTAGYARALAPQPFAFPQDHGPHPDFLTEWWYFTGNLDDGDGHHFGYQLTIFRRALAPAAPERASDWATRDIYMGHLALSDVAGGQFYAYERFSRGAADLAGASGAPFQVFLEDWSVEGSGPEGMDMRLRASQGNVMIDLRAVNSAPPVLQGDAGLSQKGPTPGNASYYYSLPRMATEGEIRIGEVRYRVSGLSWMDREWGTSSLEGDLSGWDWFALQMDDGSSLMFYRLRQGDGAVSPYSAGSLVSADGAQVNLSREDVQVDVLDTWRSPRSGAVYPARWRLRVPAEQIDLEIKPYLADQELPVSVAYWEGAVQVSGSRAGAPLGGSGYVELTGYAEGMR
ncbi:carotenoid 1,2-hydratase [Chloroflexales bacterium ZM16-3]|nr:carotenoid 1,2-hydratase [Chloroflexales bacterium ZM16-3]